MHSIIHNDFIAYSFVGNKKHHMQAPYAFQSYCFTTTTVVVVVNSSSSSIYDPLTYFTFRKDITL
jgi:hypothetical protein